MKEYVFVIFYTGNKEGMPPSMPVVLRAKNREEACSLIKEQVSSNCQDYKVRKEVLKW